VQFFLIVFGFTPLVYLGVVGGGGWGAIQERLGKVATDAGFASGAWTESWRHMGSASANPMGIEWFGMVMGLGFVMSFGYWCTDFLVIQRAMAARSMNAAQRTPILAAIPKMMMPFIVILPGMVALAILPAASFQFDGRTDYNMVMPLMLQKFYPPGLLGLGLTALLASFMSGMAGNVTAFNTVWTYDIYKPYLKSDGDDAHYMRVGRQATVFGTILSVAAAYVAMNFENINDLLQLVFSFINAPLFATFLLGMFWARSTPNGAFWGLLGGILACAAHYLLTGVGAAGAATLHAYPSDMARNFWGAIYSWTTCFFVTIGVSLVTRPRAPEDLKGLVYSMTPRLRETGLPWYHRPVLLAVLVGAVALAINVYFW
jgi:SSS family solute:Na+ symporter